MWGGPGWATDTLARAVGFGDANELISIRFDLGGRIHMRESLSRRDWTRAILSLEITFASDEGAGWEWSIVTGFDDEYSIRVIRALQAKLVAIRLRNGAVEPRI
jgi:hypothetical protein